MKFVVLYHSADDALERTAELFPAHRRRIDEFHGRGDLLMVGPFGDPQREGAMSVFRTRESAEEFVAGDPFVLEGVVARYEIREWHEVVAD